jgi:hypothetical protein
VEDIEDRIPLASPTDDGAYQSETRFSFRLEVFSQADQPEQVDREAAQLVARTSQDTLLKEVG